MSAIEKPMPGARVRVVVRDRGELFGDMLDAKLMSGRWALAIWGTERTLCVAPEEIMELEVIEPTDAFVGTTGVRQHSTWVDKTSGGFRRRAAAPAPKTRKKGLGQ